MKLFGKELNTFFTTDELKPSMTASKRGRWIAIIVCVIAVTMILVSGTAGGTYVITDGDSTVIYHSALEDIDAVLAEAGYTFGATDSYEVQHQGLRTHIIIDRACTVSIVHDGTTSLMTTNEKTVGDLIASLGIVYDENDEVSPAPETEITDGLEIRVMSIAVEYLSVDVVIEYETTYNANASLYEGTYKTRTEGVNGTKRVTYEKQYNGGVLTGLVVVSEEEITAPVNAVVEYGTKIKTTTPPSSNKGNNSSNKGNSSTTNKNNNTTGSQPTGQRNENYGLTYKESYSAPATATAQGGTITTADGKTYKYSKVMDMTATAYTYAGNHLDITASGVPVQVGVVACSRSTLPQGTKVFIVSKYGTWEYGYAVVGDTGVTGMVIDLFMESKAECYDFGVRDALVYILE